MCTDYDPPDVWRSETRRALKTHRCGECGRDIDKGETYEVCAGLTDGHWYNGKTCAQCIKARHWLLAVCSGFLVGGALEDLEEHRDYYYDKGLTVLAGRMRAQWMRHGRRMTPDEVAALTDRALKPYLAELRRVA